MGFESRAISARVTKQMFSKTCDKAHYLKLVFNPRCYDISPLQFQSKLSMINDKH